MPPQAETKHRPILPGVTVAAVLALFTLLPGSAAGPLEETPPITVANSGAYPDLSRLFQNKTGWVGADGAYSVAVGPRATVWTFGDTWIGRIRASRRVGCTMINNSAARQARGEKRSRLEFAWRKAGGKPASIFPGRADGQYYWPGDGAFVAGKLYIFLHRIKPRPDAAPPFQFEVTGEEIAEIENPDEPPGQWRYRQRALDGAPGGLSIGNACLVDGDYLYIYCSYKGAAAAAHPLVLARVPLDRVPAMQVSDMEFLCQAGVAPGYRWSTEIYNPLVLIADGAPEMSVSRIPGIPGLVAVYMPPFSREILARHSARPEGPFSAPVTLYRCPEPADRVLVYSAKAHSELSAGEGDLVVTYCRNSQTLAEHMDKPDIYFPQAVRARLRYSRPLAGKPGGTAAGQPLD